MLYKILKFYKPMNKLSNAQITEHIKNALANDKKRNFAQTVELQVQLRDYNVDKEKKFNSTVVLHYPVKRQLSVCVIGILNHVDQAKALNLDASNLDDINRFAKEAKLVKKWARKYDVLLVSESLKLKFTKLVGKMVNTVGRQPVFINDSETVDSKMTELLKTIRFRIKKGPWLSTAIGLEDQSPEELRQNLLRSVNFLISLLPKGW